MVAVNRTTKMLSFINHRIRATIVDGRQIVGRFVAFDRHMNLVLADSEEFRKLPKKKKTNAKEDDEDAGGDVRRVLGFVLLRGEEVVSVAVEGPPIRVKKISQKQGAEGGGIPGGGVARPAGRGAPMMMPGMMFGGGGGHFAYPTPFGGVPFGTGMPQPRQPYSQPPPLSSMFPPLSQENEVGSNEVHQGENAPPYFHLSRAKQSFRDATNQNQKRKY